MNLPTVAVDNRVENHMTDQRQLELARGCGKQIKGRSQEAVC